MERGKDRIGVAIASSITTAALTGAYAIMEGSNLTYGLMASGAIGATIGGGFASTELTENRFSRSAYDRSNAFGKTIRILYLLGSVFTVPVTNFILGTIDLTRAAMGNNEIKKREQPKSDEAHMAQVMERIRRMQPQQSLDLLDIVITIPEIQK
jgi:hypothetical protein